MNDLLFESVKKFLDINKERPLLLGYSGGPDSKVLLYLLYMYKKNYGLDFALAHVDHKWRETSTKEALELKQEAERLNLPFHLKILDEIDIKAKANLEAYCRELRLKFFEDLCEKNGYRALLLAHHKDDLSETVLKRVLEGAELSSLIGMEKKSNLNKLKILRPLLDFSKNDLLKWLEKSNLIAIDDETNRDTRYLRSRIRQKIIPSLAQNFGKEISNNLALTSARSVELKEYLDKKTNKWFHSRKDSPFGSYIDFEESLFELEMVELKHVIRRLCKNISVDLSRDTIDRASISLKENKNFNLMLKGGEIRVHGHQLFIIKDLELGTFDNKIFLNEGENLFGRWKIKMEVLKEKNSQFKCSNWSDVWRGEFDVVLPLSSYSLSMPSAFLPYYDKRLSKWYSETKVPLFFRFSFPVIFKEDKMFYEFLSGKKRFKEYCDDSYCRISFKLSC